LRAQARREQEELYRPRLLIDVSLQQDQQRERELQRARQREDARREVRTAASAATAIGHVTLLIKCAVVTWLVLFLIDNCRIRDTLVQRVLLQEGKFSSIAISKKYYQKFRMTNTQIILLFYIN
jgi:hypothetical protein